MRLFLTGLLVLLGTSAGWAADKVALVIGIGGYQNAPALANPAHDAKAIAASLTGLGFQVIEGEDLDKDGFDARVRDFADAAFDAKVAMFFYAGHGMQVNGVNYLIPIDAKLATPASLEFETVNLDTVLKYAHGTDRVALAFIDACRDNPFADKPSRGFDRVGTGLAAPSIDIGGTLIAFATSPGTTAAEGTGYDSPFTTALLKEIATPGVEVQQLMTRVKADVFASTKGDQEPWHNSSLRTEFYFNGPPTGGPVINGPAPDEDLWIKIASTDDVNKLQLFVDSYPNSIHVQEARDKIAAKKEYARTHVAYSGELADSTYKSRTETFVVNVDTAIGRDMPSSGAPQKLVWGRDTILMTEGKVSDDADDDVDWLLATAPNGSKAFAKRSDLILQSKVADRDQALAAINLVDATFDRVKGTSGVMGSKVAGVYGFGCDGPNPKLPQLGMDSLQLAMKKYYWTEGGKIYQASVLHPEKIISAPLLKYKTISLVDDGSIKFYKVTWSADSKDVIGFKNERLYFSKNAANTSFGWMTLCETENYGRYKIKDWLLTLAQEIAAN